MLSKFKLIKEKYSKDIQSRIRPVDQNPHIRLILELYYDSLLFSCLTEGSSIRDCARQPKVASETKEVKGNKDTYRHVDLFIEMDNVLFEYNEQGRRRLKVINDVRDETRYIKKLDAIDRKYSSTFPEEKDIKRDISMI